ncbi:MAG: phosphoenolpyruvate--protein phosphotransferase [Planctomycetota bacterium]
MSRKLRGIAAAPGIAIAPIVHFHSDLDFIPKYEVDAERTHQEVRRLEDAITTASKSVLYLRHELSASLSDHDAKIYDAQLALLHDGMFKTDMVRMIETEHVNVEVALQQVISRYEKVFESMEDPAMRERAADLRDIGRQVLSALLEKERKVYTAEGRDYIFAADEFLPSDAGILDRAHLRGIVTAGGGKYSHGAILARSLGIPSLVGVHDVLRKAHSGELVVLDGESGQLLLEPGDEELESYRQLSAEREEGERRVYEVRFLPSVTSDDQSVTLMANVETERDFDEVELKVVSGIGLFRTEFAFMERRQFPSEDDQVAMYRTAVERAGGKPVTFRTLDVGGDKPLRYFRTPDERNPVLGWRGLRISMDWPDIFYTQIHAILLASAKGRARILLPMVTTRDEVARCRTVLDEIREELRGSGTPFDDNIELGVMVEVPALVSILDLILPMVDFASVGTNDLVQYLLAVDRDNPKVAALYDPYHPSVLRVLQEIARQAEAHGKPVSICGEIAGDHYYTPLLLGLGFRELSMSPVFLPRVKLMVRSFSIVECQELVATAMTLGSAAEIRKLAKDRCRQKWSGFLERGGAPPVSGVGN